MTAVKTERKLKVVPDHRDKFGRPLAVGTHVVYPSSNQLCVGVVSKVTPKMLMVKELSNRSWRWETRKYPTDLAIVDGPLVTFYILKNSA